MARYIMTIANDGYLYPLTLIKDRNQPMEDRIFESDTLKAVREGMYRVAQGAEGTARRYFYEFPVNVGAKTGTAEKEGNIPPADEIVYLRENLQKIDPELLLDEVLARTDDILRQRNEELAAYQKIKSESEDPQTVEEMEDLMQRLFAGGYIDEAKAMRQAIKELSDNNLTDTEINSHRDTFDSYAWFVGFAPYEDPRIAVVVFIPQGGHGAYGTPIARDIIAHYLGVEVAQDADQQETD
jgi:penicillin-binding protein 2